MFDDFVAAMTGCTAMTFASTAEALFAPVEETDKAKPRAVADKIKRWTKKLLQEAETEEEMIEKFSVATLRSKLNQDLKNYLDLTETTTMTRYIMKIDEWSKYRVVGKSIFKESSFRTGYKTVQTSTGPRKQVTCFYCGKNCHISRECRARIMGETQQVPATPETVTTSTPQVTGKTSGERKPIVCFTCLQVGHKSPNCPKKQQVMVKRIRISIQTLKKLKDNDVFATVAGVKVPTTIDSGAYRSEEMVAPDQFTGREIEFNGVAQGALQAKIVNVSFKIAGVDYKREVLALPVEQVFWTAVISFNVRNKEILGSWERMNWPRRSPTTCLQRWSTARFRVQLQ